MNPSSRRNRENILARIATQISEWVRQEIVDDDPWDDEANGPETRHSGQGHADEGGTQSIAKPKDRT